MGPAGFRQGGATLGLEEMKALVWVQADLPVMSYGTGKRAERSCNNEFQNVHLDFEHANPTTYCKLLHF